LSLTAVTGVLQPGDELKAGGNERYVRAKRTYFTDVEFKELYE